MGSKYADLNSITEISIAIKVASMPACASCARHIYPRLRSYFGSRFGISETYNAGNATTAPGDTPMAYDMGRSQRFRYWGLRKWQGNGDCPPQITPIKEKSTHGFSIGNFSVLDEKNACQNEP